MELHEQGFVFIGPEGSYAQEGPAGGFGRGDKTVRWVTNMAEATIFRTAKPWLGMHNKHLDSLKTRQVLQAVVTRTVKLYTWQVEGEEK